MLRKKIIKSEHLVYAAFLLLGFIGVAYLKGFNTVCFLILFLLMFAVTGYSIVGIYNLLRGIKAKWLVWQIISNILIGTLLYYQYGSYALLKAISVSVVIVVVIGLYLMIFNRYK